VSVLVWPPPIPVTVKVQVPVGVATDVVMVSVELVIARLTAGALKPALAPGGNPLTLKTTLLVKSLVARKVIL
jgi:hypothetical protein